MRNMSKWQYRTMRYIMDHDLSLDDLRGYCGTTINSLVSNGWIERRGTAIMATQLGTEAVLEYARGGPNLRQHEAELSDHLRLLLHMRALHMVAKAG